jgi:uncharacterized protein (TIGR02145 family)
MRDAGGKLITNHAVGIRISILQGSVSGTPVFVETQTPTTNTNGLVTLEIGSGTPVTGNVTGINWANGPYFIKTETDPVGVANYTISGTSQLLSVPYALYAKTAESISGGIAETDPIFNALLAKGIKTSDTSKWNAKSNFSGSYADLKNKPTLLDNATIVTTSGNQIVGGNKTFTGITTVAAPVNASDAATKAYVDALLAKISALENSLVTFGFNAKDIEGNIYNAVKIGAQVWMSENLKTTRYRNGDLIGTTTTLNFSTENAPKYQWAYNDDENNVVTYGRLYTWYTVTDSRNVCPLGWHIPTDAEWTTLENYLLTNGLNYDGSTSGNNYAKALAAITNWVSSTVVGSIGNTDYPAKRNVTGFTALPGGYRNPISGFYYNGNSGLWWASTESSATGGWYRDMNYDGSYVIKNVSDNKNCGYAVRCVKD